MGNLQSLLFSMEGRIPRSRFWLGVVILAIAGIIISFILGAILGVSYFNMASPGGDMQAFADQMVALTQRSGWSSLITYIILVYPMACLIIKRRHDRGKSGVEFWIYAALAVIGFLIQATGMGYQVTDMGGVAMATPNLLMTIVLAVEGILALFFLVVCGFLRGDSGDNAYGPDPLGGGA